VWAARGLKPFPWRSVAAALTAMPGVRRELEYVDVEDWRQRVKKRVYVLPDQRAVERV
jgi:hypothetical protein